MLRKTTIIDKSYGTLSGFKRKFDCISEGVALGCNILPLRGIRFSTPKALHTTGRGNAPTHKTNSSLNPERVP